jgi:hypothetical protein
MFAVRFHGRGGQGVVTAAELLALGTAEAVAVYRRTRDRMPAHDIEVEEALEEGVTMRWLSAVAHADEGTLRIEKMRLDDTGFPQPTGEFEELSADCLILAPRHDMAGYGRLNTCYYSDAPAIRPKLAAARRTGTFDEVTGGLDASTALFEARRCMVPEET